MSHHLGAKCIPVICMGESQLLKSAKSARGAGFGPLERVGMRRSARIGLQRGVRPSGCLFYRVLLRYPAPGRTASHEQQICTQRTPSVKRRGHITLQMRAPPCTQLSPTAHTPDTTNNALQRALDRRNDTTHGMGAFSCRRIRKWGRVLIGHRGARVGAGAYRHSVPGP